MRVTTVRRIQALGPPLAHLVGSRVVVRLPTPQDSEALAEILRDDQPLRQALGMCGDGPRSGAEYLEDTGAWAHLGDALCLAIVSKQSERAVGMISLSHVDPVTRTARIGYWTASAWWRQRLTGEAFGLVL